MNLYLSTIKQIITYFPAVVPYLKGRARWVAYAIEKQVYTTEYWQSIGIGKTYQYMVNQIEGLVQGVYDNNVSGEFIDIMANLISGQLTQSYEQAWKDEEGEGELPDYLTESLETMILDQYDYVDQYYRDIVDARVDETPIGPLLARATLWANRWNEAYNQATLLIRADNGDNLEWVIGETEEHCPECFALNGIVAKASEWEELNVHPQGAPNDKISCGGWKCDCSLSPTDKRRSPKAFESIMNIVSK